MPRIKGPAVFRAQFLRDVSLCGILILTAAVLPRAVAAETDETPLTPAPLPRSTGGEGAAEARIRVGIAQADITPPAGFPMAGYYHERLAEGVIDPLYAKAIVLADESTSGAIVVCDLIGIATDLKNEVRRRASKLTGIPPEHIGISATHTHTAPDYMKEFLDHVTAQKKVMLDALRHKQPFVKTSDHITWGLSRSLAGVGDSIPVDIVVYAIGEDVAIVSLPGEVFVDLGLAIKRNSPFRTTLLLELSNQLETIYVPPRAAYVVGSYEVTNSTTQPGSGELVVETALRLLQDAAQKVSK